MQNRAMREYAARRGWTITMQVKEVGSGAAQRQRREGVMEAARRREIDVVVVWRLDRWGRSVTDLLATLQELEHLGVGFVSLTEALDLTTPAGRAMAALLAVFAANAEGAKSLASACGLDWPMPGRNSAAPASANPRSPAVSTSAALRCAVS
jgi:DNA invertase Pin-like site-specific DNA recombinase